VVELFARWFHYLVDPQDRREADLNQSLRDLDRLAGLVRDGRKEEAIRLCRALKKSGDASVLAMDTVLEHLGVKPETGSRPKPLLEAHQLRLQRRFSEAQAILRSLLVVNPANVDAAMMLMRIYAEDLRRPVLAARVLQALEKQPHVPAAHLDFARRSIHEWSREKPKPEPEEPQPESLEELLARGYFGTAIELLQQKIREQPGDFEVRLRLAEVHGRYCGNLPRAEKIVRNMEAQSGFAPEQIRDARRRLEQWHRNHAFRG